MSGKTLKLRLFLLVLLDVGLLNACYVVSFLSRFSFDVPLRNFKPYLALFPWISLFCLIAFYMFDLYSNWKRKSLHHLLYTIILSILLVMVLTMSLTYLGKGFSFPRSVIFVATFLQVIVLGSSRYFLWHLSRKRHGSKKVLIVASTLENGLALAEKCMNHSKGWFVIHSFLPAHSKRVLQIKMAEVDVVLLGPSLNREDKAEIIGMCIRQEKEVLVVPEMVELLAIESELQQIDDLLVLSIQPPRFVPGKLLVKRSFDIAVSSLMLILLSPVMLILYALIKVTSPGPAIFKQERLGEGGRSYMIYKFRSMVPDAEKATGPVLAADGDPRITRIGKFMRSTRLDEIPQLFNVLKGEMSLVGPRPERPFFIRQFQESIPDYTYRLSVKPGITGLAQILANYSTKVEDKLRFDILYVKTYSFVLDIKILLQTIRVVLQREQAAGVARENEEHKKKLLRLFGYYDMANTANHE
ncbi:sugar transferase [Brevibacillus brevis]|uniref:Sugar transferase n=1 Tax=Brevibacillus brevis TaxID=1393 RepID=A0ABY9SZU1_BREBE|nr:sugar transferase [Brevibacillus brevis]WNC13342.1 sugar transferase [Brevibacillus brevis]